jgi:hypothetical protein
MVTFRDVQAVLDGIIWAYTAGNDGVAPNLKGKHNGPDPTKIFAWDTKANLLASTAKGLLLIQQEVIGQPGKGKTANIVVALTAGVPPFPQMPLSGVDSQDNKFYGLDSQPIQTIIAWIEAGCPD